MSPNDTRNGVTNGHANGEPIEQPNTSVNGCGVVLNGHANGATNGTLHTSNISPSSILVVGAGNFGAALCLEAARRYPDRTITLIDAAQYPNPHAASHDVNKIVRDDYPDILYSRMMKEAMPSWRGDFLYKPHYHEVGMLRADGSNFAPNAMATYEVLGTPNQAKLLPVEDVRRRWNGAFEHTEFGDLDKIFYNPSVGFARADTALAAVVQAAVDHGVKYKIGSVSRLTFGADGECTGVKLESGEALQADQVLLATGARTAALLAKSAPENKALHAGNRLVATGAVSFTAKVQGAALEKLAPIPVLKNCVVKGEGMSILRDGTIKFNCDMCFTNMVECPYTGEQMSVASEDPERNTWTGPNFIKHFMDKARNTMDSLYGDAVRDLPIDSYRVCWDASTPTHDFLISPHPHCKNLYIASGGSFHGWKFLPVIGRYIADMMEGVLPTEYAERWAWDKTTGDGHSANPTYEIAGDLKDYK